MASERARLFGVDLRLGQAGDLDLATGAGDGAIGHEVSRPVSVTV
jgi:hypothetical protein